MQFMKQAFGEFHKFLYEITMSVKFCLSSYPFEWDFIQNYKYYVNNQRYCRQSLSLMLSVWPKCHYTEGHMIFMTWCYLLNNSNVI